MMPKAHMSTLANTWSLLAPYHLQSVNHIRVLLDSNVWLHINLISVSLVKHFFLLIICVFGIMDYVWFSSVWKSLSCWDQSRFLLWRNLLSLTVQNLCGVLLYIVALAIKSDACPGSIFNSFLQSFFLRGLSFFHGTYYCYLPFQEAIIKRQQRLSGLQD